ncbi:hypothetical protein GCM10022406_24760 [Hymenobacter algoricola]|uniref:Carboxypeptidase-like regulatory domain-containing protein n=1 Tax=Hymenobacter algoricola TaxID=486267 RepID=A0ABP7N9L5_9BACT
MLSLLLATGAGYAQQAAKFTVSGYVRDRATGETLIGVAVINPGSGQGTATNTYGFYSLTLPTAADSVRRLVSYLGYEKVRYAAKAARSVSHTFQLQAGSSALAPWPG